MDTDALNPLNTKKSGTNPIILILSISGIIFIAVFMFCSFFDKSGKSGTLGSIKDPSKTGPLSIENRIQIPISDVIVNIPLPVQPSKNRR